MAGQLQRINEAPDPMVELAEVMCELMQWYQWRMWCDGGTGAHPSVHSGSYAFVCLPPQSAPL